MKKLLLLALLVTLITGCSSNDREKAIDYLVKNQTNDVTVIVFGDKPSERSYIIDLQKDLQFINENLRTDNPIANVSYIDISEKQQYNFEEIFEIQTYPHVIVFEKNQIVLEAQTPDEIVRFYEKEK
ncbi:hypothetical protein MHB43_05300 [Paenibacillus sp. FSL H8-0317]|uniref:hypothetical protein n=1 Tax=Paenibacillus TaxID=44249 RepID=UPI001C8E94BE|nr:hypothetical protein [Paenibacillus xylanexedens]MBY0114736.1 hypothetical protein [Paenibacillus xylanexedens]